MSFYVKRFFHQSLYISFENVNLRTKPEICTIKIMKYFRVSSYILISFYATEQVVFTLFAYLYTKV